MGMVGTRVAPAHEGARRRGAAVVKIRPVQLCRRFLRKFSWIAFVALLGLVLAPTISQALATAGPGNPWAETCSMTGGKSVATSVAGTDRNAAGGMHLEHCPLCSHLGAAPALPPADPCGAPLAYGARAVPAPFAQAPRPRFVWAAALARAPPASC